MAALDEPYEAWEARYGTVCNICGAEPKARRLQRDHEHKGDGRSLGLLCVRCNRALPSWMDAEWLERAAAYLRRGGAA
ncbi:MAG: endonuclease VII domain-containing protein [Actinomycetota bacterium]|nr:endonuclease VII domain-containing protein [Actinomycetota bacterium]